MNITKYFTVLFCVIGVCLAVISGAVVVKYAFPAVDVADRGELDTPPKDRINVLLLGLDMDESRTDSIMIASLDTVNDTLSVLSIPRDTRINAGKGLDKITHVYGYTAKEQATISAVKNLTGIPIHHYVIVDYSAFREAIDALDGVYIDVPHAPSRDSAGRRGMYYNDPEQNLYIALAEGYQLLDGKNSEHFVRFRYGYPTGDEGRINAQQYFLKELIKQKFQLKYFNRATELYRIVSKNVDTSLSIGDVLPYLMTLKNIDTENIQTFQLPGYATDASTIYGVLSCYLYNETETAELMREHFMSSTQSSTQADNPQ